MKPDDTMSTKQSATVPTTPKVDMPSMKAEPRTEEKVQPSDVLIDQTVKNTLLPLHGIFSEIAMKSKDPQLDLAVDKLAQTMTALNARSKERRKKGIYGQD